MNVEDNRLIIVVLTESKCRAQQLLESIERIEWENGAVKMDRPNGRLYSKDVIYRCMRPSKCDGMSADQVIMDDVEEHLIVATRLLKHSCVPEEFQIIDATDVSCTLADIVTIGDYKNRRGMSFREITGTMFHYEGGMRL